MFDWKVVLFVFGFLLTYARVLEGSGYFLAASSFMWVAVLYLMTKTLRHLWATEAEYRVATMIVCAVMLLSFSTYETFRLKSRSERAKALRVHMSGCELIGATSEVKPYYVEYNRPQGRMLAGVNLVITFDVTNTSKDPLLLGHFEVQYSSTFSSWRGIETLSDGRIFSPQPTNPDIRASLQWQIVSPTVSVNALFRHSIDPEKNVAAYALFKYPEGLDTKGKRLRLKVCDADNNCSYNPLNKQGEESKPGGCLSMHLVPGYTDLSAHHFED